jgi:hypothetical protein
VKEQESMVTDTKSGLKTYLLACAWSQASGSVPSLLTMPVFVDINVNMKAGLIYRFEQDFDDGAMARMVIWKVPVRVSSSEHSYKYRLVYLEKGKRVIGFDNERGKGDHRHDGDKETAYTFVDVTTLIKDFIDAVKQRRSLCEN